MEFLIQQREVGIVTKQGVAENSIVSGDKNYKDLREIIVTYNTGFFSEEKWSLWFLLDGLARF